MAGGGNGGGSGGVGGKGGGDGGGSAGVTVCNRRIGISEIAISTSHFMCTCSADRHC